MWKVLATVATIAGGALASRALTTLWRAVTGRRPPQTPENPQTRALEAVAWALVEGAVLNLARVMAVRQAARYYAHRGGGQLPKALLAKPTKISKAAKRAAASTAAAAG